MEPISTKTHREHFFVISNRAHVVPLLQGKLLRLHLSKYIRN